VPAGNQIEVHPYFQQKALVRVHKEHGIATQAWSPIGGITSYRGMEKRSFDDPTLREIAGKHEKSAAQIMLRWHLQEGRSAIPKSVKAARIAENFDVFDFERTNEEMTAIDALDSGVRGGPEPERTRSKPRHSDFLTDGSVSGASPNPGTAMALTSALARSAARFTLATTLLCAPLGAQRINDARAGVGPVAPAVQTAPRFTSGPATPDDSIPLIRTLQTPVDVVSAVRLTRVEDGRVSRRSLAIGAAVGAATGGAAGFILYRGSPYTKNEAWPLFAGSAVLGGALLGAGVGLAVVAFLIPN
jgi:hypothetical protein